jgi:hypothetical protein
MHLDRYVTIKRSTDRPVGTGYRVAGVSDAVLDHFLNWMILVGWDTVTFQVTAWDDGTALVTMRHSQIIGTHWFAVIDASTIPAD